MAEIRVNSTGGVKFYDADDSHYAQIKAGTITSDTDVLTLGHDAVVAGTKVDLNGQELILDADADTSITADTDDQIDVRIAGADDFQFTANTFTAQSGSSIVVPDGGLTFGSTAISSTAAELNILDGVTSTAAELNILDGVTSTAAELNIVDGNTSATSTTIADADRVVLNDNGTMVQAAVTDLKTYIGSSPLTKIASASDDSSHGGVNLNSIFSNTYENYLVIGDLTNTGSSDNLKMQMRDANGMRTASEYAYRIQEYDASSDTATSTIRNTGTTSFQLSNSLEDDEARTGISFRMLIFNPNSSSVRTRILYDATVCNDSANVLSLQGALQHKATETLTGLGFFPSGNSFANSSFRVYAFEN